MSSAAYVRDGSTTPSRFATPNPFPAHTGRPRGAREGSWKTSCGPRFCHRMGRNSDGNCPSRDIFGDDCVGTNDRLVSDGDARQDHHASGNPHVATNGDRRRLVPGDPNRQTGADTVIGVADTGVFTYHRAVANTHPAEGDDMNPTGHHDIVADDDASCFLGFPIQLAVEKKVLAQGDSAGAMYFGDSEDDHRGI